MHRSSATRPDLPDSSTHPDHSRESPAHAPILVGIDDAARLLGVSSRTVWTMTNAGELPHLRIGRRVLYPLADLHRWVAERTSGGASTK